MHHDPFRKRLSFLKQKLKKTKKKKMSKKLLRKTLMILKLPDVKTEKLIKMLIRNLMEVKPEVLIKGLKVPEQAINSLKMKTKSITLYHRRLNLQKEFKDFIATMHGNSTHLILVVM